jgi:hypothetical protein
LQVNSTFNGDVHLISELDQLNHRYATIPRVLGERENTLLDCVSNLTNRIGRKIMFEDYKTTDFAVFWIGGIILMAIGMPGILLGIIWHYFIFGLGLIFLLLGLIGQRRAVDENTEYAPNPA